MGVMLDKAIESLVAPYIENFKATNDCTDEMVKTMEDALVVKFRSEINKEVRRELTDEEINKQIAEVESAVEAHSAKQAVKEIRKFIFEGIFLAIIVGLIVNQMTDIFTYLKNSGGPYMPTIIIIFALIAVVLFYILGQFANTIGKLLDKDK